jgi:hypothetical protein
MLQVERSLIDTYYVEYSFDTAALDSMKSLATDVRGGIVPLWTLDC